MKFLSKTILVLICYAVLVFPQDKILAPLLIDVLIESANASKIASSEVYRLLNEKIYLKQLNPNVADEKLDYILLTIHSIEKPSFDKINQLESTGIHTFPQTWIPPLNNHPYGFMLVKVPIEEINNLLRYDFIIKVQSAENSFETNNNQATTSIKANLVWNMGYTGTGVKVAVLDSGLDTEPVNADLPATIEKRDYSNYPTSIDDNVENTVSGHGTHVTGSVLGRGTLSSTNTGNGGGAYSGSATNANLVFLKIGNDANSNASSAAMIAAIHAAVDTFNADVITMSYGGWYDHHDGSSNVEQTVDWAYSQGLPVFLSAGNEGNRGRHYSGTVNANSTTAAIRINVTDAIANSTALYFNLVWADGSSRNNLNLRYFTTTNMNSELTDITRQTTSQSVRGTESQYSNYNFYVPPGSRSYYLRVTNPSNVAQPFHIYEIWNDGKVRFNAPNPNYTVGQPSTADYGFSVGAYTSRVTWTASNNSNYSLVGAGTLNDIAPFSSRGPRIDGIIKPDITAPGSVIISIRDRDVYTSADAFWVDNDGVSGGAANYYVMQGTSMSAPLTAGSAALILHRFPGVSPLLIYNAIKNYALTDAFTGAVPNNTWGYGKLDVFAAINDQALPVELSSFSASVIGSSVKLNWRTETEQNNYGFEVERKVGSPQSTVGNYEKIGFVEGYGNSNSPKSYSFTDNSIGSGKISYRLKQIDNDGSFSYSKIIDVDLGAPKKFELTQNFPNPFNPNTAIRFSLPETGNVKLTVFNLLGQEVAVLVNGLTEAGTHIINFDAAGLNSGIYIYRIESGSFNEVRKMTLIK
jgi:subtilisin family serine protease